MVETGDIASPRWSMLRRDASSDALARRGCGVTATLLEQFPRFSEYDPGAVGEGSLDPLGLGAVADRIADRLAPGLRARMSQPRFVTLSAVGAYACQPISDLVSSDGKSTFDLAFEWLVVESLVLYPNPERLRGVPGRQKAQRAARGKERLSAQTYLAGPRVFGFTGVYRPFSLDSIVLGTDGLTAANAESLIRAWEQDQNLQGFLDGTAGSPGQRLRSEIEDQCREALKAARVTAPPTGWLMRQLAESMAPREAKAAERAVLRQLVTKSRHEIRNELAALIERSLPSPEVSQMEIALALLPQVSLGTKCALAAAIEYENCATAIDHAFRRLLAYATSLGGVFSFEQATSTPELVSLAPKLGTLTKRAIEAAADLDEDLARVVVDSLGDFDRALPPHDFVQALITRHQHVQELKGKRMWIDPIKAKWVVRPPYRTQAVDLADDAWAHPMRLNTLSTFLRETT